MAEPGFITGLDAWRVLWVLLITALLEAGNDLWERRLARLSPRELQHAAQRVEVARRLRRLDKVSDFVAVSKLQRELTRLEKEVGAKLEISEA